MIEYKTDATNGKYNMEVETDNYKYYRIIEEFVRMFIDHKFDFINNETREVELVRHGHWIVTDDGFTRCSRCYAAADNETPFCAECGMKMDKDESLEQTQTNLSLSVGHTAHKDIYTVFETVTGNDESKPIHSFKTPKGAFDKIFNDEEISE